MFTTSTGDRYMGQVSKGKANGIGNFIYLFKKIAFFYEIKNFSILEKK